MKKQPRYLAIAQDLSEKISQNIYPIGSLLPTEMQLCEIYQSSRHTIREALRELDDIGLVIRKKNIGTQVQALPNTASSVGTFEHAMTSFDDLAQMATTNRRVFQQAIEVVADETLSKTLNCKLGTRWLKIYSIRENPNNKQSPICLTHSYVGTDYADVIDLIKKDPYALISDILESTYGKRSVQICQKINATSLNDDEAHTLNATAGTPALRIVRQYLDRQHRTFFTTISIHPADRYTCTVILKKITKKPKL